MLIAMGVLLAKIIVNHPLCTGAARGQVLRMRPG